MILTLETLRQAVRRKRVECPSLSFEQAVAAVAVDMHLHQDDVLRAFQVEVEEVKA